MTEQKTNVPFYGEGDRNYDLWEQFKDSLPGPGDGKISFVEIADHGHWLLCDGRALTTNMGRDGLRKKLLERGSPYGVSGSDPLLPDCRERALMGAGAVHVLGAAFGQAAPTMPAHTTGLENQAHNHNIPGSRDTGGGFEVTILALGGFANTTGTENQNHNHSVGAVGDANYGNYPPSLPINVFIHV